MRVIEASMWRENRPPSTSIIQKSEKRAPVLGVVQLMRTG
eukprot:CAMPEP_0174372008 /NCGR_PEP_ID=MMETSP0811_2-20130205/101931_1 /TAXON_ID=73025 ORGANISM="Eutreptiella gymnastica-like, Strain CCMP1594" /NCGR_SAMPLE_ID=MMETSP0811_2 /ASSEMBLY_ACC=CAM_ASM_000667 /LENGTH=39 /DNA_ID= /DNA_START= /DNA_END= /DNA_ORIENTATION=